MKKIKSIKNKHSKNKHSKKNKYVKNKTNKRKTIKNKTTKKKTNKNKTTKKKTNKNNIYKMNKKKKNKKRIKAGHAYRGNIMYNPVQNEREDTDTKNLGEKKRTIIGANLRKIKKSIKNNPRRLATGLGVIGAAGAGLAAYESGIFNGDDTGNIDDNIENNNYGDMNWDDLTVDGKHLSSAGQEMYDWDDDGKVDRDELIHFASHVDGDSGFNKREALDNLRHIEEENNLPLSTEFDTSVTHEETMRWPPWIEAGPHPPERTELNYEQAKSIANNLGICGEQNENLDDLKDCLTEEVEEYEGLPPDDPEFIDKKYGTPGHPTLFAYTEGNDGRGGGLSLEDLYDTEPEGMGELSGQMARLCPGDSICPEEGLSICVNPLGCKKTAHDGFGHTIESSDSFGTLSEYEGKVDKTTPLYRYITAMHSEDDSGINACDNEPEDSPCGMYKKYFVTPQSEGGKGLMELNEDFHLQYTGRGGHRWGDTGKEDRFSIFEPRFSSDGEIVADDTEADTYDPDINYRRSDNYLHGPYAAEIRTEAGQGETTDYYNRNGVTDLTGGPEDPRTLDLGDGTHYRYADCWIPEGGSFASGGVFGWGGCSVDEDNPLKDAWKFAPTDCRYQECSDSDILHMRSDPWTLKCPTISGVNADGTPQAIFPVDCGVDSKEDQNRILAKALAYRKSVHDDPDNMDPRDSGIAFNAPPGDPTEFTFPASQKIYPSQFDWLDLDNDGSLTLNELTEGSSVKDGGLSAIRIINKYDNNGDQVVTEEEAEQGGMTTSLSSEERRDEWVEQQEQIRDRHAAMDPNYNNQWGVRPNGVFPQVYQELIDRYVDPDEDYGREDAGDSSQSGEDTSQSGEDTPQSGEDTSQGAEQEEWRPLAKDDDGNWIFPPEVAAAHCRLCLLQAQISNINTRTDERVAEYESLQEKCQNYLEENAIDGYYPAPSTGDFAMIGYCPYCNDPNIGDDLTEYIGEDAVQGEYIRGPGWGHET